MRVLLLVAFLMMISMCSGLCKLALDKTERGRNKCSPIYKRNRCRRWCTQTIHHNNQTKCDGIDYCEWYENPCLENNGGCSSDTECDYTYYGAAKCCTGTGDTRRCSTQGATNLEEEAALAYGNGDGAQVQNEIEIGDVYTADENSILMEKFPYYTFAFLGGAAFSFVLFRKKSQKTVSMDYNRLNVEDI